MKNPVIIAAERASHPAVGHKFEIHFVEEEKRMKSIREPFGKEVSVLISVRAVEAVSRRRTRAVHHRGRRGVGAGKGLVPRWTRRSLHARLWCLGGPWGVVGIGIGVECCVPTLRVTQTFRVERRVCPLALHLPIRLGTGCAAVACRCH